MGFFSAVKRVGQFPFPAWSGVRAMMMPFRLDDVEGTVPWWQYRVPLRELLKQGPVHQGIGYLTIDEAFVKAGTTHRRPGLHVDGIGPDGRAAAWGGGGGWGANGMLVAASHLGCIGFDQHFEGWPGLDGDCAHLESELDDRGTMPMWAASSYYCNALAVHESVRMQADTRRQFVRVSLPSDCPWYEGYTESPFGVKPTGPIHPGRAAQMGFRP